MVGQPVTKTSSLITGSISLLAFSNMAVSFTLVILDCSKVGFCRGGGYSGVESVAAGELVPAG